MRNKRDVIGDMANDISNMALIMDATFRTAKAYDSRDIERIVSRIIWMLERASKHMIQAYKQTAIAEDIMKHHKAIYNYRHEAKDLYLEIVKSLPPSGPEVTILTRGEMKLSEGYFQWGGPISTKILRLTGYTN